MFKQYLPLIIIDILTFYITLIVTYFLRKWLGTNIFPPFIMTFKQLLSLWWFPVIYILSFMTEGLYTSRMPLWEEVKKILKAVTYATIIILAIVSLGKLSEHVSRTTVVLMWFLSIFTFSIERVITKKFLYKLSIWKKPITAIGNKDFLQKISDILNRDYFMGYFVAEKVEIEDSKKFEEKIKNLTYPTVVISIPDTFKGDIESLLAKIQKSAEKVLFVPEIKGLAFLNSELYPLTFSDTFLLSIKNNLKSKWNKALKNIFDITVSILLLPILLPIIGILAVLIKLDSEGPVFFVHKRIGKDGKEIGVIKFRTMYKDSKERLEKLLKENPEAKKEWETYYKLKNDPRVTKIGKFLRKTSLDELPQIFNVLKGEMSLVGPRPVIKEEIDKYYKEFAQYYYLVKPGITGLWQVSGRSDTDYEKRVRLDTWYVLNWSLWLDIVILIKTIKTVLKKEGAY